MRLTAKFQLPKVDFGRYRQTLHETLSETLAEAARQYLMAIVPASTMDGIPVWSAASRATFSPLASYVAYALALAPEETGPDRIQLGLDNGDATFEADRNTGVYRFSYSTTLPHLIVNEYFDATQWGFRLKRPGPYHFQEAGERAFQQFASNLVLPGWGAFLDVVQLRVG